MHISDDKSQCAGAAMGFFGGMSTIVAAEAVILNPGPEP